MKYLLILVLISSPVFAEYASEANIMQMQKEYYQQQLELQRQQLQLQQQQLEQDKIQNELYLQQQFHRDIMKRIYNSDKRTY